MRKKISVAQLRAGMYLDGLDGGWLQHAVWRTRFLVRAESDLVKLRESAVQTCWIDTSRGDDLSEADALASEPPATDAGMRLAAPATVATDFVSELEHAAGVCDRAKAAVRELLSDVRMGRAVDAQRCLPIVDEITSSVTRNNAALLSLVRLKTHDDYSYLHSVAVCALMVSLGRELGMDTADCTEAGMAGLLHDVGKACMPAEVLLKPGRLTDDEFAIMKGHPHKGHALLLNGQGVPAGALDVCLHHHERFDGAGYPEGLAGEGISRLSRMAAICDVYDAVTSNRPYKHPWDPAQAIAQMASWRGHFDAAMFSAFVRCLGMYPTGSLVRLKSERLAVVMESNPGAMSNPVVRVFFSVASRQRISPQRLDLADPTCDDFITGRELPADWPVGNIEALWSHGHAARILGKPADWPQAPSPLVVRD
jgi:HD-GYP domain-containing protein (c-di-GMP phosphodiesterase class II)